MDNITKFKLALKNLHITSTSIHNIVNMMLSRYNNGYGSAIVSAIEQHIFATYKDEKLACLYLIDALIKKYGTEFVFTIQNKIVLLFTHVFEKSINVEIRQNLFKLRCAWKNVFSQGKLYAIDVNINAIDNAWPIMVSAPPPLLSLPLAQKKINSNEIMQNKCLAEPKAKFLSENGFQHFQNNMKHHYLDRTDPRFKIQNFISVKDDTTSVNNNNMALITKSEQVNPSNCVNRKRPTKNNIDIPSKKVKTSNDNSNNNKTNSITELMEKLKSTGLIKNNNQISKNNNKVVPKIAYSIEKVVALTKELFQYSKIKSRNTKPIDDLHNAMQCSKCGLCFASTQFAEYGEHLDWHFQQKTSPKNVINEKKSRDWYSRSCDWLTDDA